ncbi:MAG: SURF1 family protein [Pseudomonadota bacterium]
MRMRLSIRPIPLVATVLLVALGLTLGQWQERRAQQKIALQAKLAERAQAAPLALDGTPLQGASLGALEYRRVRLTGQFVREWPLYLDNRPYQNRAGFYLLMPFRLDRSNMHVLVARGWQARSLSSRLPAALPTPTGSVTIEGVVKSGAGHVMELGQGAPLAPGALVQNITPEQLAQAAGIALQPFIVEQTGPAQAGEALVRDWPAPALGVEKHKGYAFQWYALAAMAFIFFVVTGFKRGTE